MFEGEYNELVGFLEKIKLRDMQSDKKAKDGFSTLTAEKDRLTRENAALHTEITRLTRDRDALMRQITALDQSIANMTPVNERNALKAEADHYKKIAMQLNNENTTLKNTLATAMQSPAAVQAGPADQQSGERILRSFNRWAENPHSPLPPEFKYLAGNFRIRTTQAIDKIGKASDNWICNTNDREKYLFPNPQSFDPLTDITELYEMDSSLLKPKGTNRLRVIKPCEISDSGYINYPGELQLI